MKRVFSAAALSLVSILATPLGAWAQAIQAAPKVSSAAGNSTGATISGSYYEDRAVRSCSSTVNCFLTFASIPAKKRVIVSNVTCALRSGNRPVQLLAYEGDPPSGSKQRQLNLTVSDPVYAPDYITNSQFLYYTNISIPVRFLIRPGANITLNFFTVGGNTYFHEMSCSIVGSIYAG